MKKALIPILLVLLLSLAFTSCDANIRQDIAGLMGDFSENVYIESGMVEADLGAVDDAKDDANKIGTSSGSTATATVAPSSTPGKNKISTGAFGIDVSVDVDPTEADANFAIIAPQTPDEQQSFSNNIADSISSTPKLEQFLTNMAEPATSEQKTSAQGTVTVFNATVAQIAGDITDTDIKAAIEELTLPPIADDDELTQGDMAVLQLMTNLVANTITAAKDEDGDISEDAITDEKALDIFSEALFTAKVAEELSGISTINFSGDLITGLLGSFDDDDASQSVSRTTEDDSIVGMEDIEDSIGLDAVNSLVPKIIKVMGITGSGTSHVYTPQKYRSFIRNQTVYLASLNQAVAFYREGTLSENEQDKINTGTLIKYILAFMTTMIDDYYENYATYNNNEDPAYESMSLAYAAFLNENPKLAAGTLVATDTLDTGIMDNILGGMEAYILSDGMQRKLTKLVARTKVLVEISGFVNEDLDELLDDLPTTIEEWFADDTDVE